MRSRISGDCEKCFHAHKISGKNRFPLPEAIINAEQDSDKVHITAAGWTGFRWSRDDFATYGIHILILDSKNSRNQTNFPEIVILRVAAYNVNTAVRSSISRDHEKCLHGHKTFSCTDIDAFLFPRQLFMPNKYMSYCLSDPLAVEHFSTNTRTETYKCTVALCNNVALCNTCRTL